MREPRREPVGDIELRQREVGENLPDIHGPSLGEKQNHSDDADQISRGDARGAVAIIVLVNGPAPQHKGRKCEEYCDEIVKAFCQCPAGASLEGNMGDNDSQCGYRADAV